MYCTVTAVLTGLSPRVLGSFRCDQSLFLENLMHKSVDRDSLHAGFCCQFCLVAVGHANA